MTYVMNMKEAPFAQLWHFQCKYDIVWDVFVITTWHY